MTTSILLAMAAIIVGFIVLLWSADRFVLGASVMAKVFNVSPLIIGILIVGFGTSAPEMLVSAIAALEGNSGISIGNAIGSNIINVGLVLAITALFYPLQIKSRLVKREMPILLLAMAVAAALLYDLHLSFMDGAILIAGMVGMLLFTLWDVRQNSEGDALTAEWEEEMPEDSGLGFAVTWLLVGLGLLLASSKLLVWGAVEIATIMGIDDLIIGLTIVAIGTSLPELAATIAAARRSEDDIAVGNIVGSNIFNIVGVMALPGLLNPSAVAPEVMSRDFPMMVVMTVVLLIFAWNFRASREVGVISRFKGVCLLALYIAHSVMLYQAVAG
ncbi:calcium/sodium antiporter [Oceanicoccus sagamiensis]|uniref:calcium/sodium antiporter n=1 Tax=Oceanicoccus sagamiensis TaxID=716816 RepID=UPI000A26D899|nr:calcium/sodium antiporter [Oceanicoccus sagamiensis]